MHVRFRSDPSRNRDGVRARGHKDYCFYCMIPQGFTGQWAQNCTEKSGEGTEVSIRYWFPWQPTASRVWGKNKTFLAVLWLNQQFQWIRHVFFSGPWRLNRPNRTIIDEFRPCCHCDVMLIKDQRSEWRRLLCCATSAFLGQWLLCHVFLVTIQWQRDCLLDTDEHLFVKEPFL